MSPIRPIKKPRSPGPEQLHKALAQFARAHPHHEHHWKALRKQDGSPVPKPQKYRYVGDHLHVWLRPIARLIDRHLGTSYDRNGGCSRCRRWQQWLNRLHERLATRFQAVKTRLARLLKRAYKKP